MRPDRNINAALIERLLLSELNQVREQYERAGAKYDQAILESYSAAIKRFSDFILEGTLPPGYTEPGSKGLPVQVPLLSPTSIV
jgi:hypothetical protein